ncbi:MAG: hypothetical protein HEQ39_10520 [Rhizobacter sp.]
METRSAVLTYHAMRLAWCRVVLMSFLRRWAVYLAVVAVLFAAGSVGAWSSVTALAAWLVLPLFYATAHPVYLLPVLLIQTLLHAGLIWALRSLLWFEPWAEAERALPLAAADLRRSDGIVVLLVMAPLFSLYALGATTLWITDPAWLHDVRWSALGMLLAMMMGAAAVGLTLLHSWRRPPRIAAAVRRVALVAEAHQGRALVGLPGMLTAVSVNKAMLLLPLVRGPARRAGKGMCGGGVLLCAPALGLWWAPHAAPWWLAAFALLSLVVTTRVHTLARDQLEPFWLACCMLPMSMKRLRLWRAMCVLSPLALGALWLLVSLPPTGVRWLVFAAYGLIVFLGSAWVVCSGPELASSAASRWLLFLTLSVALATEVMA